MIRARYGRIVNVSSIVAATGSPGQANYAAAKAGLVGLSRSVARELASRGITVNVVAPGPIVTAMTDGLPDDRRQALADATAWAGSAPPTRWPPWSPSCAPRRPRTSPAPSCRSTAASAWDTDPLRRSDPPRSHHERTHHHGPCRRLRGPPYGRRRRADRRARPGHRAGAFKDDLDADSLDLVELVMELEDRFDITIPEEDLEDVRTVGDALDLILAASAAKA